ncbi:MAG: 30S ribosomal protein S24e [Methanobrevibacter sp.]|jgi:small subunit ribosomal protein S24e|nr:30S ribosomal protein S24e [Candidatus Methanoflexus mossambicus]
MEIKVTQEKVNKLLKRTEIKFDCIYSGEATPTLLAVKNKLVALLNSQKNLLVVDNLQPHFGEAIASGYAKVYDSAEALKDIETKHVIEKNTGEEAPAEDDTESEDTEDDAENE